MANEMREVTKEEFYAAMGPKDVHPQSQRFHTDWVGRHGQLLGRESTGYASGHHAKTQYFLCE